MPTEPSQKNFRPIALIGLLFAVVATAGGLTLWAVRWGTMAKARKLKNPVPATAEILTAGRQLYAQHCKKCHGENGDGKGEKAPELSVEPGDFTDASKMSRRADGELYWQISYGRMPMPAFADKLSDEARWQLVDYIRTFVQTPQGPPLASPAQRAAPPQP
jgi:mono/diheme cytochrome c family protein